MSSLCMVIHIRSIHQGNLMKTRFCIASVLFATLSTAALAQSVDVKDAWARSTVQGQKATGAFMKLTAKDGAKLVGASSPAAGVVEVHEMKMEGDVMKMRAIPGGLDLPAGKAVELKPGGYHVMLMDLKGQVKEGQSVPLTLVVEGRDKKRQTVEVKAQVRALNQAGHGHAKDAKASH
jgi:copper(I)-binding protein